MTSPKETNRNLLLGMAVFSALCLGLLYAWSLFISPLEATFGWVRSQTSIVYSISMACYSLGSFFSGRLSSRLSPKSLQRVACALIFIGFFFCSKVNSLWQFCIFYGVLCGMGIGFSYQTWLSNIVAWFRDKKGFAAGMMTMGFGLSAFLLGSLITVLLNSSLGWRNVFLILAFALPVILLLTSLKLEKAPAMRTTSSQETDDAEKAFQPKEMIRTSVYWAYLVWQALLSLIGVCIVGQCAVLVTESNGSSALAALAVGLLSIGNGTGRLLNGLVFDKFGKATVLNVLPIGCGIASIAICIAYLNAAPYLLVCSVLLLGICYGGTASFVSMFLSDTFGVRYLQKNHSTTSLFLIPMFFGSYVIGFIRTVTGSYTAFFLISILLSLICLMLGRYIVKHT